MLQVVCGQLVHTNITYPYYSDKIAVEYTRGGSLTLAPIIHILPAIIISVLWGRSAGFVTFYCRSADKGHDACFNRNLGGNIYGNCGSDGTNFIACASRFLIHPM